MTRRRMQRRTVSSLFSESRNAGIRFLPSSWSEPALHCLYRICGSGIRKSAWLKYRSGRISFNSAKSIIVRSEGIAPGFSGFLLRIKWIAAFDGDDLSLFQTKRGQKNIEPSDNEMDRENDQKKDDTDVAENVEQQSKTH